MQMLWDIFAVIGIGAIGATIGAVVLSMVMISGQKEVPQKQRRQRERKRVSDKANN